MTLYTHTGASGESAQLDRGMLMIYNTITSNAATADNDESSARATPTQRWPTGA